MTDVKTIEDCFRFRLLRAISPSIEKSKRSLELAKRSLSEMSFLFKRTEEMAYKFIITSAYMAMFHAARAVLYKDGIQEKSHYAIFVYLKEKYSKTIPSSTINLLNIHRIERHEAMYGLDYNPNKEDALGAQKDAKIFIKEIEKLLGEKR